MDETRGARARSAFRVFAGLFLLFQIAVPLRWYVAGRIEDERFSWRMFSSYQMRGCRIGVRAGVPGEENRATEIRLQKRLPGPWLNALRAGYPAVVESFLRWECEDTGAPWVHYQRRCALPDGTPADEESAKRDCRSGETDRRTPS